jgi:hypothetical protein
MKSFYLTILSWYMELEEMAYVSWVSFETIVKPWGLKLMFTLTWLVPAF